MTLNFLALSPFLISFSYTSLFCSSLFLYLVSNFFPPFLNSSSSFLVSFPLPNSPHCLALPSSPLFSQAPPPRWRGRGYAYITHQNSLFSGEIRRITEQLVLRHGEETRGLPDEHGVVQPVVAGGNRDQVLPLGTREVLLLQHDCTG